MTFSSLLRSLIEASIPARRGPSLSRMADHAARLERRKGLRLFRKGKHDESRRAFQLAKSYDRLEATSKVTVLILEHGTAPIFKA